VLLHNNKWVKFGKRGAVLFDVCIWGVGWWKGRGIKSRRAIEEREGLQDKPNVSGLARFIFFKNISRLPHD
jgi:hypothetical protein